MRLHWLTERISGNKLEGYRSTLASNRYRVIQPVSGLDARGHHVEILVASDWNPDTYSIDSRPDAILVGKFLPFPDSASFLAKLEEAGKQGIARLADINDDHFNHPLLGEHWRNLVNKVDGVVAGSESMAEVVRKYTDKPIFVVSDPIGSPRASAQVYQRPSGIQGKLFTALNHFGYLNTRVRLVWYGSPTNWDSMSKWAGLLGTYSRKQKLHISIVTQPQDHISLFIHYFNELYAPHAIMELIPWEEEICWEAVHQSHAVLIPSDLDDPRKSVKTSNRLIDAINCGRFAICSPVPAYKPLRDFVWMGEDPVEGLSWLIDHPQEAIERIQRGQQHIEQHYSVSSIASSWEHSISATIDRKHHPDGKAAHIAITTSPAVSEPIKDSATVVRLNLGCGDKILDGYINVDVSPSRAGKSPDVLCDLHRLSPFSNDQADEILAVHVIEHFWRWEVVDILKEWLRVLKPGGQMILECPNLISACREFLTNPQEMACEDSRGQKTMWVFYGDPGWKDPLMIHRWGYTPESLGAVMREAGLINVRQEPAQFKLREPRDMRIVGEKPYTA